MNAKTIPLALLALSAFNTGLYAKDAKKMNILFIAVDDLRTELGCYGTDDIITPNIDRVASEGVQFDRSYVNYPLSLPSRAAMLTGMRFDCARLPEGRKGKPGNFDHMISCQDTWARVLHDNGYYTATAGKIYHGNVPKIENDAWDIPEHFLWRYAAWTPELMEKAVDQGGREDQLHKFVTTGQNPAGLLVWQSLDVKDGELRDGMVANNIIKAIKNRPKNKPFAIAAGMTLPHLPMLAPSRYFDMYPEDAGKLAYEPEGNDRKLDKVYSAPLAIKEWNEGLSDVESQRAIRAYMACVTYADAMIGRILNVLKQENIEDETIVVIWGDHGYHLTDHGLWRKNTPYHIALHSPLIIKVPGYKSGRAAQVVENIDIYPTLMELAGLNPDVNLQGQSLVPILKNNNAKWDNVAYTCEKGEYGLVTEKYRFTLMSDGTIEMYDLENDINEWNNIAQNPKMKSKVKKFTAMVKENWNLK